MTRRSVSLYERNGSFFIVANDRTDAGFAVESDRIDEISVVDDDAVWSRLAEGTRLAVSRCRSDVPAPPAGEMRSRMPDLVGSASFAAFVMTTASVHVSTDDEALQFQVTPMRGAGASRGFEFLTDRSIDCAVGDLAAGLADAFAVARSV